MTIIRAIYGLVATLTFASTTLALHASEAGVVDWHKQLIGIPLVASQATAPTFHRVNNVSTSVILTATASNVLAALNPITGDVAWRHTFDATDLITTFRAHEDVVVTLSGPGGATFRSFDALTGHLVAETRLHKPDAGRLFEPANLGSHLTFLNNNDAISPALSDVFVLTNGHILRRVNTLTGETKWGWSAAEDLASLVVYSNVVSTSSSVYLIGLKKTATAYTLRVEALSSATGELMSSADFPSSIHNGLTDFLVLSDIFVDLSHPRVVWLEQGTIKSVGLTSQLKDKPISLKGAAYESLKDVGLNNRGHFVALKSDGTARIMKLDKDGKSIKGIFEFSESANSERHTNSLFAGGLDKNGYPYIGRVYWSNILGKATAQVFSGNLAEGKGMAIDHVFSFETNSHGIIDHIALDAANPDENTVIARIIVTTSTGAMQLWQQGTIQWTREESLAEINVAEFVELPERKAAASHAEEDGETFSGRLVRQISDAKDFPTYLAKFAKRFATGSYDSLTTSAAPSANSSESLFRDAFGFRKVVIVATSKGTVFGISSSNGAILWSRILGLGWAHEVGGRHHPLKLFVTKTVSDGDTPQVVLLTQRTANNGLVDTVVFHLNPLTGHDVREISRPGQTLEGVDAVASEVVDAFMLRDDNKTVVMVDPHLQVYLYPDTEESKQSFSKIASHLYFPLRANDRILGHQILPTPELTGRFSAYTTWTSLFAPGEEIVAFIPRPWEPVASFGKVLGNRSTLYKYLNPHLIAVGTISRHATPPTCGVYLLDGAKGTILYHADVPTAGGVCDVIATLTENWLVYMYYDGDYSGSNGAKGHRVVSVELYEGNQVDDKTRSSDMSIYSNRSSEVLAYQQSFVFPQGVTAMSTTSTKFGITVKDIIVASDRNQIQSVPRRILDPRRPKHKPTTEEQEEWLIQYEPVIPNDQRRVISHGYEVAKIQKIITSPALLESTSLVFAYGLDLFSTRVAPSNTFDVLSESFNKAQLILTVSALCIAIIVTRPMVQRKKLRERWYHT